MISIEVTDPEQLAKGNPKLLVYNAIVRDPETGAIIVSNGAQTDFIVASVGMVEPGHILDKTLPYTFADPNLIEGTDIDTSTYEPDSPIFTPRVSGVVFESAAMLAVVKRGYDGEPVKSFTKLPLEPGVGFMVATYDGPNPAKPAVVPSFSGEPRVVKLAGSPEDIAGAVYDAIGDFRVSAACMTRDGRYAIKNLHGDGD
jgi:IMP cyclohydrolase